jgi:predicted SprT family Zn-dependent metalloprotease
MKIFNCWCKKASPIQLIHKDVNMVVYMCLKCKGTITINLDPGEIWEERSSK